MPDNLILNMLGFRVESEQHRQESPELQAIDDRLDQYRARTNSQGFLERGLNTLLKTVWHGDVDSQKELEILRNRVVQAQNHGDVAAIKRLDPQIKNAVQNDAKAVEGAGFRDGVSNFVTNTAIQSTYFIRGSRGRMAASILTGVNDIHLEDGARGAVLDATLGSLRGYLLARTFETVGTKSLSPVAKGVSIGLASRLENGLLNAQNYKDPESGKFSLGTGLKITAASASNPYALLADATAYGLGNAAIGALSTKLSVLASFKPVATNVVSGFTMGTVSGANGEIQRESKKGHYSINDIFDEALLGGTFGATSAALGAKAEGTRMFAPGPNLFRSGVIPDDSIMLPSHPSESAPPGNDTQLPPEPPLRNNTTQLPPEPPQRNDATPLPPVSPLRGSARPADLLAGLDVIVGSKEGDARIEGMPTSEIKPGPSPLTPGAALNAIELKLYGNLEGPPTQPNLGTDKDLTGNAKRGHELPPLGAPGPNALEVGGSSKVPIDRKPPGAPGPAASDADGFLLGPPSRENIRVDRDLPGDTKLGHPWINNPPDSEIHLTECPEGIKTHAGLAISVYHYKDGTMVYENPNGLSKDGACKIVCFPNGRTLELGINDQKSWQIFQLPLRILEVEKAPDGSKTYRNPRGLLGPESYTEVTYDAKTKTTTWSGKSPPKS